jgi:hypothetical protein
MDDFIGILVVSIFAEFLFWGLSYAIGCALTPIISFGKWLPDSLSKDEETGKIIRNQSGFKLIKRSGQIYLGAWGVSFLGFCFIVSVILLIVFL